jgi:SAM-dependent methyltransferase
MRFTCNICGAINELTLQVADRERSTCSGCRSSMRFRSVVLALSRAICGMDLKLDDFPVLKSIRGLGISDSDIYARRLEERFTYMNTYYHREPVFDVSHPDESEFGKYDFVICSDVLEHVAGPIDCAFQTLARLLKPTGFLILTVPYVVEVPGVEHFSSLHSYGIADVGGRPVLVNRSADGRYEVFDELRFHGGSGATLEMRVFSQDDISANLTAAGFARIHFEVEPNAGLGVVFSHAGSLPVIASKAPFVLGTSGIGEVVEQLLSQRRVLSAVRESRWVRLGRLFGCGPDVRV